MKPQPICTKGIHYIAKKDPFARNQNSTNPEGERPKPVEEHIWCEDASLRGLVAQLHALKLTDVTQVTIDAQIEGWQMPITVNPRVYSYSAGEQWFLQAVEDVPEYWDFPAPYVYFALDWKDGLYLESPTLQNLVRSLHEVGRTFVSSFDLKIGARFAREDSEADDIVQVPLSLVCYDYDPEDDHVFEIDEGWDETDGVGEFTTPCSPLPLEAELVTADVVLPHFLLADIVLVHNRRLKQLLQDEKPTRKKVVFA